MFGVIAVVFAMVGSPEIVKGAACEKTGNSSWRHG